ncbi:MAG: hypothetical protein ACOY3P_04435 [Planctomycetota bacterium]
MRCGFRYPRVVCQFVAAALAGLLWVGATAQGQIFDHGGSRDFRLAIGSYNVPEEAAGIYRLPTVGYVSPWMQPGEAVAYAPPAGEYASGYYYADGSSLVSFDDPLPPPPGELEQSSPFAEALKADQSPDRQAAGQQPGLWQARQEPIGRAPEDNRLQFLRSATPLLQPGQFQFDWGVQYSLEESAFPVIVPPGLLDDRRIREHLIYSPFALRFGVTQRAQGFVNLPVGWGHTEVSDLGFQDHDTVFDVGDVSGGVNYLLRHGQGVCSDIIFTFDFLIPTGALPFRDNPFAARTGDGFYSLGASMLFIHEFDPIVLFYGAGYRHRFERGFLGGMLRPGEEVNYNLGIGFGINERITLSSALLGSFRTDYEFDGVPVFGSSQEPISLRIATTIIADDCRIIEPFVFLGLTEDAADAQLGIIVTRSF